MSKTQRKLCKEIWIWFWEGLASIIVVDVFFVKYVYWSSTFFVQLLRTTIYNTDNRQWKITHGLDVTDYINGKNNNI